uniref:DH domain-containing protein n=1 Tax=Soboliphyme baturini TaxID=241478 RepID=A0A183IHD5_9BILA
LTLIFEDARAFVVREIFETESSYVESLNLLVHKYLRPLKRPELCTLIEPGLLNSIFFQIPEILGHHELLYSALKARIERWDYRTKVGDIILNSFTKQSMIDTYTAFINNWRNARMAIRSACHAKPAFAKYLERCSREHKNKLTLDALLIMPVQRVPRYKLLIKELLKHTSVEHADYPLLLRAEKEIHELATKIDQIQTEVGMAEQMQQQLREIEAIVEGLDDLVAANRSFNRYDLTPNGTKERCFFLFSDLLVITTVKRRHASNARKGYQNFLEQHKFKLLMKVSLEDLNIIESKACLLVRMEEDLRVLGKVYELTMLLKSEHQVYSL